MNCKEGPFYQLPNARMLELIQYLLIAKMCCDTMKHTGKVLSLVDFLGNPTSIRQGISLTALD